MLISPDRKQKIIYSIKGAVAKEMKREGWVFDYMGKCLEKGRNRFVDET